MSPTIFPSPNPLQYNSIYGDTFVNSYFNKVNKSEWAEPIKYVIEDDPTNANFKDQLIEIDDAVFTSSNSDGTAYFGNYYFYKIDKANGNYAIF